ncbi:MAG: hypothetical protein IPL65_22280 [Lewinellaceae bacterium]|nr:hypothetical protein [Lewinellaceae bacterium]
MKSEPPRRYGAPIDVVDGRYFCRDRNFSISHKPLNAHDINVLREALMVLMQFQGLPMVDSLDSLLKKLEGWVKFPDKNAIRFETNDLTAGTEWLPKLYSAIMDQKALRVDYLPFVADAGFPLFSIRIICVNTGIGGLFLV